MLFAGIDVRHRGAMHDDVRLRSFDRLVHGIAVRDVERRVGEGIDVHAALAVELRHRAAEETAGARYDDFSDHQTGGTARICEVITPPSKIAARLLPPDPP